MDKRIRRRDRMKILFMLFFISIIIFMFLFASPVFRLDTIEVEGSERYSKEEIISHAGISKGMHILQVNKRKSSEQLLKLPYLKSVKVITKFPNRIQINIEERKPIGYVPFSGTYLIIDKTGQVIDQTNWKDIKHLPIIEGLKFDKFTLGETIEVENDDIMTGIIEITSLLEKYELLDREIKVNVSSSDRIRLYIDSLDVIIGEINMLERKIQWLREIIDEYDMGVLDLTNINEGQAVMSPLT